MMRKRSCGSMLLFVTLLLHLASTVVESFQIASSSTQVSSSSSCQQQQQHKFPLTTKLSIGKDDEWESDFDDFEGFNIGGDSNDDSSSEEGKTLSEVLQSRNVKDLSACRSRQLSLGRDFVLSDFVGNMGFDEVTDWEYYYQNEDDEDDRKVVQPNPFDEKTPRRTRSSSGSVIRLFRGELVGPLGGGISAQGYDRRVLIKEYFGDLALELARAELASIAKLQSDLLQDDPDAQDGEWYRDASARSVGATRKDDSNVQRLMLKLKDAPFVGILGECNLNEIDDMDPNEFYRALSVPPPKPDAIWIVYEYPGLSSIQAYANPAEIKRSQLPPKKGFFGPVEAPPIPKFEQRAKYVVKGILKGALEAVANLHDAGLVHRSIGRSSFMITTTAMDKREPANVYTTNLQPLRIKLTDFGFAGPLTDVTMDEEFCRRARTFGYSFAKGDRTSIAATNFAIAEDMHALGFVAVGLLLSCLAELKEGTGTTGGPPVTAMPATDEDTLQRLLGDIFDKDIVDQFRDYVAAEEDIWTDLVEVLDEDDKAGWKVLETLFTARERAAKFKDSELILTSRGLLNSPFFN